MDTLIIRTLVHGPIYIIVLNYYTGLTDKVLESVVAKGNGELVSMDLSAVPHLLTEHALSVIG